jgi:hypothetical protein
MTPQLLTLALLALSAFGQTNITITPPNWTGLSGTFTINVTNPPAAPAYYYLGFVPPGTTMQANYLPSGQGSCAAAITHNPGMSVVSPSPTTGWFTQNGAVPTGAWAPIESGFWYDTGSASNGEVEMLLKVAVFGAQNTFSRRVWGSFASCKLARGSSMDRPR